MIIDSRDGSAQLVEANVIESFERGSRDLANTVVRYQKVFFPAHKDVFSLGKVFVDVVGLLRLFGDGPIRREPAPVLMIDLLIGTPLRMPGLERVFWPNHFTLKICSKSRMFVSQS